MAQQYARTVINNYRMAISIGYLYQIVGTIFNGCSTDQHGGAIHLNHVGINCTIFHCSFVSCYGIGSSSHGGAIAVEKSNNIRLSHSCFISCKSYRCPGYIIWGHKGYGFQVISTHFNMSSEYHPDISGSGSCLYSFEKLIYSNNNVSHSTANSIASGITFGAEVTSLCGRFFTFVDCSGNGMIGNAVNTPNIKNTLELCNFINCNALNGYGMVHMSWPNSILFHRVVFSKCGFQHILQGTSSGSIEFQECHFDSINSGASFSYATTINCDFIGGYPVDHVVLDTLSCHTASYQPDEPFTFLLPFMLTNRIPFFVMHLSSIF